MILVDTSVWIDHFNRHEPALAEALTSGHVVMHPDVLGELACGNLPRRQHVLAELRRLPVATSVGFDEVLHLVDGRALWGRGLGWTDARILATCLVASLRIGTRDRVLSRCAVELGLQTSAMR